MTKNSKPTIAFITTAWQNVDDNIRAGKKPGGVPSVAFIWSACLKHGFDVHVFVQSMTEPDWPKKTIELDGVTFHWIKPAFYRFSMWLAKKNLIGLFKPLWLIGQFKMLLRFCTSKVKPDAIYSMRSTYSVTGWLLCRLKGAKFIQRMYGIWVYDSWFEQKKLLPKINALGEYLSFKIPTDLLIITNDGSSGDKIAKLAKVPEDNLRFWINGVDKSFFIPDFDVEDFKQKIGIAPDAPMLLTVGRLFSWKRVDRVINAIPAILEQKPDIRFVIVGDGSLEDDLKDQVNRMGLGKTVVFAGAKTHEEVKEYLNACDIFLSTHDHTNMCSTLIESLIAGCCVVTRDAGTTTEIAINNENAIVLNPGEPDDIAKTVLDLLNNPEKRLQLSKTAHESAMQRFQTWEERIEMEVYEIKKLLDC